MNDDFTPNDKIVPAIIENEGVKYVAVQFHISAIDENKMLWTENEKLLQRIDKAIEHIEHNFIDYESAKDFITYDDMLDVSYLEIRQLLEILRGEE